MQIIKIKVKTKQPKQKIIEKDGYYEVHVRSAPEKNKANLEIIKLLSREFKEKARILQGSKGKEKLIKIGD